MNWGGIHIKRFLVVDGHSLAYRGFHAIHVRLTAPDGTPTSTIVGFMNMLYRVQDELSPDVTTVVFDANKKTFRHEIFSGYKNVRAPFPDELRIQISLLQKLLSFCGIRVIVREGVEADDTAASIAKLVRRKGYEAVILSSDKDLFQLIGEGVRIMRPVKGGVANAELYTEELFIREYGFHPASMPDYLAIAGDPVDNVKGVHGIGKKGAATLLSQYPTVEAIYASLDELPKSQQDKLKAAGEKSVIWVRDNLIMLRDNVFDDEPEFIDECINKAMNFGEAEKLALRLGLSRVLKRIGSTKSPLPREFYQHGNPVMPQCEIITQDYKSELSIFPARFRHSPKIWDLKTAYYLLHPDEANRSFPALIEAVSKSINLEESLKALAGNLEAEIESYDGLREVMNDIDLPVIPVLNRMEDHGVRIDPEIFESVQAELSVRIECIEAHLTNITGLRINVNSPAQVSWLLFEKLGFTPSGLTKGKTSYTTEAGVLENLAKSQNGEAPALILEHRELSKMLTGFVIPFLRAANRDGIIHTTFEPAMTGTGRLSSREPNMQNIPAFGEWAVKIKSGLVPVNPDNVFVSADYSQVELRVLAHMSGEERLIDAFIHGRDIHAETASWVFDVMPELVTPEMRRAAKMINFGLLYGMSSFGLAERLGVGRHEAQNIMNRYFDALPHIKEFIDGLINDAKERGYSRTLAGRIRPVNEIPAKSSALDRALINSPIQGTAADIARKALVAFDASGAGELFLQVHDSLVCECSADKAEEVSEVLRKIMAGAGGEISLLKAESKIGRSLADV